MSDVKHIIGSSNTRHVHYQQPSIAVSRSSDNNINDNTIHGLLECGHGLVMIMK